MKEISGGITAPKGFRASGIYAGIKRNSKLDLALICSDVDAFAAGVFTKSRVKAAPVILTQRQIKSGVARAVIINSGNANACTGNQGMKDAAKMIDLTARSLSIDKGLVCVASTGVIGELLPMDKIGPSIAVAAGKLRTDGSQDAAAGIMTTDTFPKEVAVRGRIGGRMVTVGGIAKGSGMIHPQMATMLGFISTDVRIGRDDLKKIFRRAVNSTFNRITVDGDTSTNDMVLCLANGMAENKELTAGDIEKFEKMLVYVCYRLARMIVKDGEGATKLVDICVRRAVNETDAAKVGFAVANSNLVKTALFACDPNWGRIMAAIGYSGARVQDESIAISFDNVKMVSNGIGMGKKAEKQVSEVMKKGEYRITIDLGIGKAETTVMTSDLSYDYVKINVAYRS